MPRATGWANKKIAEAGPDYYPDVYWLAYRPEMRLFEIDCQKRMRGLVMFAPVHEHKGPDSWLGIPPNTPRAYIELFTHGTPTKRTGIKVLLNIPKT